MSHETADALLERATDAALDAACLIIQEHLGVTTGDFAGLYWSGLERQDVRSALQRYYEAERANAKPLSRREWNQWRLQQMRRQIAGLRNGTEAEQEFAHELQVEADELAHLMGLESIEEGR